MRVTHQLTCKSRTSSLACRGHDPLMPGARPNGRMGRREGAGQAGLSADQAMLFMGVRELTRSFA